MGVGVHNHPSVFFRVCSRRHKFRMGGTEADAVPDAPLEVASLVCSYPHAVLRGGNRCRGGMGESRTQSQPLPPRQSIRRIVVRRRDMWVACLMRVLDLAHEGIPAVCNQPNGVGRTDNVWSGMRRGYVGIRRLVVAATSPTAYCLPPPLPLTAPRSLYRP